MSRKELSPIDVRLRSPFTAMVSGPSGCGKTEMMMNLIKRAREVSRVPPVEIIYCYGVWQPLFVKLKEMGVTLHEGAILDVRSEIPSDGKHRWMIVDDLMHEVGGKSEMNNIFTKYSHHMNLSIFFITQTLFEKSNRTVSLNSHYFFLFKNPRNGTGISVLASQAFPGRVPYVREAFQRCTLKPFSYMLIDLKPDTDERFRLIGNYASSLYPMSVYIPKER